MRTALVPLLIVLALSGCGEREGGNLRFGIGGQFLATGAVDDPNSHLTAIAASGIDLVRHGEVWNVAEPNPPVDGQRTYLWGEWDRVLSATAVAGVELYAIVAYGSRWSNGDLTSPDAFLKPPLPNHYADFAAYAGALAGRYGRGGEFWEENPGLPAGGEIRIYEIWNEPNLAGAPTYFDPGGYAQLYLRAAREIRRADPDAQVVFGSLAYPGAESWLREAFAAEPGLRDVVDRISVHLYGGDPATSAERLADFRAWIDRYGDPSISIDVSEDGIPVPPADEVTRGGYFREMVEVAAASEGVATYIPYVWLAPPGSAPEYSLAGPDAVPTDSGRALIEAIGAERGD